MKNALLALLLCAAPLAAQTAISPAQINLRQIPCTAAPNNIGNVPVNVVPIIIGINSVNGVLQTVCYTIAGATITPANATLPATITLPVTTTGVFPTLVFESPAGAVDGKNTAFTLSAMPSGAVMLMRNGVVQCPATATCAGGVPDFTSVGSAVTVGAASIPQPGDVIIAAYWH